MANLKCNDRIHLVPVTLSILKIKGLSDKILSVFNNSDTEKYSDMADELYELSNNFKFETYELIIEMLSAEDNDKDKLSKLITDFLTALGDREFKQMIANKQDARHVAISLAVLDDYIDYLEFGVWKGAKINTKELESKIKAREIYGIDNKLIVKQLEKLRGIKDKDKATLSSLTEISKESLLKELVLLYNVASEVK